MITRCILICFVVLIHTILVYPRTIDVNNNEEDYSQPGFWRTQFNKAANAAGRVSDAFGSTTSKLMNAMDKVCQVFKKIVPIVGAICTVGQFKFCALDADGIEGLETIAVEGTDLVLSRVSRQTERNIQPTRFQPIDLNQPD